MDIDFALADVCHMLINQYGLRSKELIDSEGGRLEGIYDTVH